MFKNVDDYLDWYYTKFNRPFMPQWTCFRQDHKALVELIIDNDVKSILEVGTWSGWTTMLMWLLPNVKEIQSIDIHAGLGVDYFIPNHSLMPKHFYGYYYKDTPVRLHFESSLTAMAKIKDKFDMVFIDGNHDYKHVKSDTEFGLKIASKVIAWHDYGSEPAVNEYLDGVIGIDKFSRKQDSLVAYKLIDQGVE